MAAARRAIRRMNRELERQCPICQCELVLPVETGCHHKFCFTCLKGVSTQNQDCPICRGPVDPTIINNQTQPDIDLKMDCPDDSIQPDPKRFRPEVVVKDEPLDEDVKPDVNALQNGANGAGPSNAPPPPPVRYFWLYQGRHQGWWRFDPRTERDIEEAHTDNKPAIELMICATNYVVDFGQMIQYPKNRGVNSKRAIKRVDSDEFDAMQVKGIAGVSKQ